MSASAYVSRLDSIIERAPKEGYKAAVVLGVINSVRTLVEDLNSLAEKIRCLSEAKGGCKDSYCRPGCGGLVLMEQDGYTIIEKHDGNTFGATISDMGVEIKVKDARMRLSGSELTLYFPAGEGWASKTVNLEDYSAVYESSYSIKYAMKRLARPIRKSIEAVGECGKRQAVIC